MTEKCFNDGHLDFYGDIVWIKLYKRGKPSKYPKKWTAYDAVRTRNGTFPPGSEWARFYFWNIENPHNPPKRGWHFVYKDLVMVPENIEPGQYVLSFRWDCDGSPQVWNSCANIEII